MLSTVYLENDENYINTIINFENEIILKDFDRFIFYLNEEDFISHKSNISDFLFLLKKPLNWYFTNEIFSIEFSYYTIIRYIFYFENIENNFEIIINNLNILNKIETENLFNFCYEIFNNKNFLKRILKDYNYNKSIIKFIKIFFQSDNLNKSNYKNLINKLDKKNNFYKLKYLEKFDDYSIFDNNNLIDNLLELFNDLLFSKLNLNINFNKLLLSIYNFLRNKNKLNINNIHFLNFCSLLFFKEINEIINFPTIKETINLIENKNFIIFENINQLIKNGPCYLINLLNRIRWYYFIKVDFRINFFANHYFKMIFFYYSYPIYKILVNDSSEGYYNNTSISFLMKFVSDFILLKFKNIFVDIHENSILIDGFSIDEILYFLSSQEIQNKIKKIDNDYCYKKYYKIFIESNDKIKEILELCNICGKKDEDIKIINFLKKIAIHKDCIGNNLKRSFNQLFISDLIIIN